MEVILILWFIYIVFRVGAWLSLISAQFLRSQFTDVRSVCIVLCLALFFIAYGFLLKHYALYI